MRWPLSILRPHLFGIAMALALRYACFAIMMALCLFAERRPAPHLPDLLIDHIPYQPWIDRWNNWLLILCYIPLSAAFLLSAPQRFIRYNITTALLSLLRGGCIVLTGLGPVRGPDLNAGQSPAVLLRAFVELLSPFGLLVRDAPHLYMTKDLFFSGHTAVTFLLLLYLRPMRRLFYWGLVAHIIVVLSVFLSHLHYSIDVVGAYAITFALFVLREGWSKKASSTV